MADSVEAAEVAELVELRDPNLSEERQEEVQTILDVLKAPSANSWFSRDVTKILKSKPGGLQKFYLHLRKDYLKIYSCTIP